ncbi:uncharacterized protein LOC122538708 isoform X1 [Frieseomelitta varia]|uniref:uncharacterized protein LOC122538708 isoform X1 n=1 Tax=Frieseomelitta varia TaxID=561572 RepID=UPI001CB681C9|nr:uncharacterized protein LOC122538708 isoform X1 [Frieseomelitta varia]
MRVDVRLCLLLPHVAGHQDKGTSVKSFSKWLQFQEQTESTKGKEESYALKTSNSKSYSGFIFGGNVGAKRRSVSPIPNRIPGFLGCCSVVAVSRANRNPEDDS